MANEERRIEILKAASRLFYVKGFEKSKIEEVAKEAGIGKGTVYEYFESKQQLFEEMVAFNREVQIKNLKLVLDAGQTFREQFIALAKYQTELASQHSQFFTAMACSKVMAREMGALFLEQNIRGSEILKELVVKAMDNGELRPDIDPEIVASVMMGTVNQYCSKKVIFFHVQPNDMKFEEIVDTVMKGIAKKG